MLVRFFKGANDFFCLNIDGFNLTRLCGSIRQKSQVADFNPKVVEKNRSFNFKDV